MSNENEKIKVMDCEEGFRHLMFDTGEGGNIQHVAGLLMTLNMDSEIEFF